MHIFAERMKEKRLEHGLSQVDLAREIGCGKSIIGEIERGKRNISKKMAFTLANYFDTDILYWLQEDIEEKRFKSESTLKTLSDTLQIMQKDGRIKEPKDVWKEDNKNIILHCVELALMIQKGKDQDN